MPKQYAPLTMGSVRARRADLGAFTATEVAFPPMSSLPSHRHERPVVAVILDGAFEDRFARGPVLECIPATVFTEPAGAAHANRFAERGARVLALEPDMEQADLLRPCAAFLGDIHALRDTAVAGLAWRMAYELRHPDGVSPLALAGLGLELLARTARAYEPRRTAPPAWLLRAEALLRDCFLDDLCLAEIAAAVDVHPVHLARVFRAYFRQSIGAFVRTLRLDWAAARLATTPEAIAQIALRAGFADQSHFTRAFKQHTGCTPGAFRKATA